MSNPEFVYGYHAIKALIDTQPDRIIRLILQENRQDQRLQFLLESAEHSGIAIVRMTRQKIDDLLGHKTSHQGIVAECSRFMSFNESALQSLLIDHKQSKLLLALDGLKDPHNLGACIRNANAFGVHAVIAPKDRAVGLTPTVRKVASGAASITPFVQVTNLVRTLRDFQEDGIWLVGMTENANSTISEIDLTGDIVVVMGEEGSGLRRLTQKCCDYLVKIPMLGTVGSLNVSAATAVTLYEVQRQRL